jgi:hypothetical protein
MKKTVMQSLILLCVLVLAGCFNPMDYRGDGNLSIVLPGGDGARAVDVETLGRLSYTLDFSGPGGETFVWTTEPGVSGITVTVSPGEWKIQARAFLDGTLYGTGELTLTVKAGPNSALIKMRTILLTSIDEIIASLNVASGGGSPADPVFLPVELELSAVNWTGVLDAINTAGKFVALDLSASAITGTTFDPDYTVSTGKDKIVSLILPAAAMSIAAGTGSGSAAFGHFAGLKSVSGANITTVGDDAFIGCNALTTVNLPAATSIGESAFHFCTALETADLPVATTIGWGAFASCTALTTVNLPVAATISGSTFFGCTALSTVNLPAATGIGNSAFEGCTAMVMLSLPATPPLLGSSVFQNTGSGGTLTIRVPSGAVSAYTAATPPGWDVNADMPANEHPGKYGSGHKRIVITDTLTSIDEIAVYLAAATGGVNPEAPVSLPAGLNLADDWSNLLSAIQVAGKYVALDLSASAITGTEFDPRSTVSTGKDKIVSLVLPGAAASIAAGTNSDAAFKHFTALTTVSLPASLSSINGSAFSGCVNLSNITVDPDNPNYSAQNGMLLDKAGTTLIAYPSAAGAVSLTSITSIGDYAFASCTALTTADLPAVTSIGSGAFGNTGGTSLTVTLGSTPPTLGVDMFSLVSAAKTVTVAVPFGAAGYGSSPTDTTTGSWGNGFRGGGWNGSAFTGGSVNASVTLTITDALTSIADITAYLGSVSGGGSDVDPVPLPVTLNLAGDWSNLLSAIQTAGKYVDLDLSACTMSGMTAIPGEFDPGTANTGESKIVSLVLPTAATSIKDKGGVVMYFTSLKSVSGAQVTSIGHRAFVNCTGLTSVSFPKATYIGGQTFANCTGLTSVSFPAVTSIGQTAFGGTGLTSVDFPAVVSIGEMAFSNCTGLTSVSLPASLSSIHDGAFRFCRNLDVITVAAANPSYRAQNGMLLDKAGTTLIAYPSASGTVTLDNSITTIAGSAFFGAALTALSAPAVMAIGDNAFAYCDTLPTLNLPAATTIGASAFFDCVSLTTVSLPAATSIGYNAFDHTGGTALTVTLGTAAPTVGTDMFGYVNTPKTVTVTVPPGATGYGSSPTDTTTGNWGNGFRGGGWNGSAMVNSSSVNANVTLTITDTLTSIADITAYLASATGGGSAADPVPLRVGCDLSSGGDGLLNNAIATAGKYVDLDISACYDNGGLDNIHNFSGYNGLLQYTVTLVLPDQSTAIGTGSVVFSGFSHLKEVRGANITTIGQNAFSGCTTLTTVSFPKATTISQSAFSECTALTTVSLPAAVNIGYFVFGNTGGTSLTVALGTTPPTLDGDLFDGVDVPKTVTVTVPSTVPATGSVYGTIPGTYSGSDTSGNWGNAFRGLGFSGAYYTGGTVNPNITLTIEEF